MSVYKSAYAALQVCVRPEIPFYHPVTGVETSRVSRLVADFGLYSSEWTAANPITGEMEQHATIIGHYYDTEVAAEKEGWTDEERESVEHMLDKYCREQPYLIAKIDMTSPPAPLPWPTYDTTDVKQIVKLAISLGLVREAVAYEKDNVPREEIVAELEDWIADNPVQPLENDIESHLIEPGMITLA